MLVSRRVLTAVEDIVDAEPVGETPVQIRVCPLALNVLVPANANPSLFTTVEK